MSLGEIFGWVVLVALVVGGFLGVSLYKTVPWFRRSPHLDNRPLSHDEETEDALEATPMNLEQLRAEISIRHR